MSLGFNLAWRLKQPKQKRCQRCGLYYDKSLTLCAHCGQLSAVELTAFIAEHKATQQSNAGLGNYFIFVAIIIVFLLLGSFL